MTGYLFQVRYALLRGLREGRKHPGYALSVEKFDDVAFEDDGKPVELIQTKHHGTPGNTSDGSPDLWKTLKVWMDRVHGDPMAAADTRFVLLTTNTAADGSALQSLRHLDNSRDPARALERLISVAREATSAATREARTQFLGLDAAMRKLLVQSIWVFDNAQDIIDVREEIEQELRYSAPSDAVCLFTDYLEGWWFNRVVIALRDPHLTTISLSDISSKIYEFQENFRIGRLPLDETIDAMPPVTTLPHDDRVFVRQMNLVRASESELLVAIHDYYRASEQRSRWARENLFLDGEADRYDRVLWDDWRRCFHARVADLGDDCHDEVKEKTGRRVFRWACQHQRSLRNRDEIWLSSGSFQILADSVRIGWHPDYRLLLTPPEDSG